MYSKSTVWLRLSLEFQIHLNYFKHTPVALFHLYLAVFNRLWELNMTLKLRFSLTQVAILKQKSDKRNFNIPRFSVAGVNF